MLLLLLLLVLMLLVPAVDQLLLLHVFGVAPDAAAAAGVMSFISVTIFIAIRTATLLSIKF